jgi:hypothetical protein
MSGGQIDRLCLDWLSENYGEETASEYQAHSLLIPLWNPPDLNKALETLRQVLSIAFGPGESFATVDYHEARRRLRLLDDSTPIPAVFIQAFAGTCEEG